MGGLVSSIFGGDNAAKVAEKQAEQQRRQQIAQLARERASADQEASAQAPSAKSGRKLLTFAKETLG